MVMIHIKKVNKSAVDGRFVSKEQAKKNPQITYAQTVKIRVKKKK